MTVPQDHSGSPVDTAGNEQSKPAEVAETASSEVSNVVSTAGEGAREAAGEASTQVKVVAGQTRQQLDSLLSQTRDEVRSQAEGRSAHAAEGLRTLSQEVSALAEGRPDDAGPLLGLLEEAQHRVSGYAERLENGGAQGVVDDVTRFARRRPGMFLAGAVGAGFLVGRLVRAGAANGQQDDQTGQRYDQPRDPMSAMGEEQLPTAEAMSGVVGSGVLPPPAPAQATGLPVADTPTPGMLP